MKRFVVAVVCCLSTCSAFAQDKAAKEVRVVVNPMVIEQPGKPFVEVDTANSEAGKNIEKALKKSSDLLLTKRKPGSKPPDVMVIVGVASQRIVSASELRPDLPLPPNSLGCMIETKTYVVFVDETKNAQVPYTRERKIGGLTCESAAENVALDLIAWIDANRSRF